MSQGNHRHIDLVLEGGGIKGLGFIGALRALENEGYTFRRVAGTSSGAIIASLIAAGYTSEELEYLMHQLDYRDFADESMLDKFGVFGKSLSVLLEKGIYEGKFTRQLLTELLAAKGIKTFGDLRIADDSVGVEGRYRLVVLTADVTRSRLMRLPWDYPEYGLNPDEQLIVDAVHASSAIPFYYEPARLGKSYMVDGAIASNFPIWLFEGERHSHCRHWPTFGIKLSARPESLTENQRNDTSNTFTYAFSILRTILDSQDQIHLEDPCTLRRTIFIDSQGIKTTDFDITPEQQQQLYEAGLRATKKFLKKWDFQQFIQACPEPTAHQPDKLLAQEASASTGI